MKAGAEMVGVRTAAVAAGKAVFRKERVGRAAQADMAAFRKERVGRAAQADMAVFRSERADRAAQAGLESEGTALVGRGNAAAPVGSLDRADMEDRADRADMEGMEALAARERVDRALEAEQGGMDLASEDRDDPTSSLRRRADTTACNSSSSLYFGVHSSNFYLC